jgi:Flp pilus assembly protein TadD
LDHLERALASLRAVGDRRGEAETLNDLGTTLLAVGQRAEAAERHRQALTLADAIGDRHEHGRAVEGLRLTR